MPTNLPVYIVRPNIMEKFSIPFVAYPAKTQIGTDEEGDPILENQGFRIPYRYPFADIANKNALLSANFFRHANFNVQTSELGGSSTTNTNSNLGFRLPRTEKLMLFVKVAVGHELTFTNAIDYGADSDPNTSNDPSDDSVTTTISGVIGVTSIDYGTSSASDTSDDSVVVKESSAEDAVTISTQQVPFADLNDDVVITIKSSRQYDSEDYTFTIPNGAAVGATYMLPMYDFGLMIQEDGTLDIKATSNTTDEEYKLLYSFVARTY